eukprot:TRINITY_DN20470_c0_g1_i1.p1 TRINITY_DN20470_c0_g1~~TRINITY_DN20470_c0_g1_i1.p1  ORF type:complete len:304 (+),score=95.19 TRINITY_DN20470_c0_g1_i1:33-914(+)
MLVRRAILCRGYCTQAVDKKKQMSLVQELRGMTAAGLMDCKKALVESEWNVDGAVEWLKERGIAKADKAKKRTAANGLVGVGVGEGGALMYELNSESDFVAKTEGFVQIFDHIYERAKAMDLPTDATPEALAETLSSEPSIEASLIKGMSTTGEKHHIRRATYFPTAPNGAFGYYIHNKAAVPHAGLTCSLVELIASEPPRNVAALTKAATQVAQHIVAESLSEENTTPLKEQLFMQTERTVGGFLKGMAKQAGCKKIEIGATQLWRCGEGVETAGDSFADEVAKMVDSAKSA